jgi:S-formylglutathione hydrolase FrmB
MKKFLLLSAILWVCAGSAQTIHGKIVIEQVHSVALQNRGGENPVRSVTVYLPPGYEQGKKHYPVIYYLHGFLWNDSLLVSADHINLVLDKAIATGKIRPVIFVMPNEKTLYGGSFYTNSSLTGNWADFTAKELVAYIDGHFRTIADRDSRGISGHSMGGHGAIKLGMLFPGVFSSVYAFSPAVLGLDKEFGANSEGFKRAQLVGSKDELVSGREFLANAIVAVGRAYSPNSLRPPFYCDLPYTYVGDSVVTDRKTLALWEQNTPLYMIDRYADNLRKLKALKLDWGRNDEFSHIPSTCLMFSRKLERLGINHYAEEYIGTHGSKILTDDGRALNEMLPFFNTYLNFEEEKMLK